VPPRIGITCTFDSRRGRGTYVLPAVYARAVAGAGGLPVLLPHASSPGAARLAIASLDGIVFSGGDDYDPKRYGARRHRRTRLVPAAKEASDFNLIGAALRSGLPLLGICGGCQLLNVARGGSLLQDIASQRGGALPHRPARAGRPLSHPVAVRPGSLLHRILGRRSLEANSSHHQAIDRVGRGLRAVAWSPDGVIEGIEDPARRFAVGVQWHPERLFDRAAHRHLFEALVRAASRGA
jgi:putative glutamine amidotransferase